MRDESTGQLVNPDKVKEYDYTLPPVSNGFGFVCFENEESAQKAVAAAKIKFPKSSSDGSGEVSYYDESEVIKYMVKEHNDIKKVFNNIYVKNFPAAWTEEDLRGIFSKYGEIKSLFMRTSRKENEG